MDDKTKEYLEICRYIKVNYQFIDKRRTFYLMCFKNDFFLISGIYFFNSISIHIYEKSSDGGAKYFKKSFCFHNISTTEDFYFFKGELYELYEIDDELIDKYF